MTNERANNLGKENDVIYSHMGLVDLDSEDMKLLNFMQSIYQMQNPPMSNPFDNTKGVEKRYERKNSNSE